MQGAETGSQQAAWFVEPDRVGTATRGPRAKRLRHDDDAASFRTVIASSFFFVLLAMTLLLGGHAAIDPLLRIAIAARDGRAVGDVTVAMPDGKFCRHMAFDNNTAEVLEGTIERCPDTIANEIYRNRAARYFSWGQNF